VLLTRGHCELPPTETAPSDCSLPGILLEAKRVNVDFPAWMVESIDRQARRFGITRQSLIKMWLAEKLQQS